MPETRPAISAAVIVRDGRVLLVRRRKTEGALIWQFPAGQVEAGESDEDAAVRETFEETGVCVAARRVLGSRVHPNTGRDMVYVACDLLAGEPFIGDADELDAVEFAPLADIRDYVPYPFYEPVQEHLDAVLAG